MRLVRLETAKDVSELYLTGPERVRERLQEALAASLSWDEHEQAKAAQSGPEALAECGELARAPRILDRLADELRARPLVGEKRHAKLLYLALTSRLFERPVSVAVKGASSSGKSFLVQSVLAFFPEGAYCALTAMSERALVYWEEPLKHRVLVLYEDGGLSGKMADYFIRSLLSEGRLRYVTVEKTDQGLRAREMVREGPTGLLLTTTKLTLHHENETRLLSITVCDTAEQTRAVLDALGREAATSQTDREPLPDIHRWHALQDWLATGERGVVIPYGETLSAMILPKALRLRRDFTQLLTLVRAHALLHRAQRERDSEGCIVATLDDYAVVRDLVNDQISEGAGATVSATVRETVAAVEALNRAEVSVHEVADQLELDESTALRRVKAAIKSGYLQNLEDRPHHKARLVLGGPLPDTVELLPTVERLQACIAPEDEETSPLPQTSPGEESPDVAGDELPWDIPEAA